MTREQIQQALEIATSSESLEQVDHSCLEGLYLPKFRQVFTTIRVVAKMLRELVVQFNGEIESNELAQFSQVARSKILV